MFAALVGWTLPGVLPAWKYDAQCVCTLIGDDLWRFGTVIDVLRDCDCWPLVTQQTLAMHTAKMDAQAVRVNLKRKIRPHDPRIVEANKRRRSSRANAGTRVKWSQGV